MMRKQYLLVGLVLLLLLTPMALAGPLDTFTNAMSNLLNFVGGQERIVSFIVIFVLALAALWIGAKAAASKIDSLDENSKALQAFIVALAAGGAIGIDYLQTSVWGFYIIYSGWSWIVLAFIAAVTGLIIYHMFKDENTDNKALAPFIIALLIVVAYKLLEYAWPGYKSVLGDWGDFVELIYWVAAVVLVIGVIWWLYNNVIGGLFGLKAKTPLSDEDMEGTKKAIKQKSELKQLAKERKAAEWARKKERNQRKSTRRLDTKLKKAAKILGSLHQAVAQKKPQVITGDIKNWWGQVKELEKLKVRIGAYAGLIAKILAETAGSTTELQPAEKTKFEVFEASLMRNTLTLEKHIAAISNGIKKIDKKTPANDRLWTTIITAIKGASNTLRLIHKDALGALALDERVRERIGRA